MSKQWQRDKLLGQPGPLPGECQVCEAMCPDAVDGTLSTEERRAFDKHVAGCAHCARELGEAQRGAAWLGLLKDQAPEPPSTLLSRILAETTGRTGPMAVAEWPATGAAVGAPVQDRFPVAAPAAMPAAVPTTGQVPLTGVPVPYGMPSQDAEATLRGSLAPGKGKLLAFRRGISGWSGETSGPALHPRLAMTAAMAFFSIALTLNMTGVHLRDVRLADLEPAHLQRAAATAQASAVRSFQNLRVVYQVESRVSELRRDPGWEGRFAGELSRRSAETASRVRLDRGED